MSREASFKQEQPAQAVLTVNKLSGIDEAWENAGRPEVKDIVVGGRSLLESTKDNVQSEIIKIADNLVVKEMSELGLDGVNVDSRKVAYLSRNMWDGGHVKGNVGWIFLNESRDTNLATTTHELLHTKTPSVKKGNRIAKSGFDSVWGNYGEDKKRYFEYLNEGITEKLAREICARNSDSVERCATLNSPERIAERKALYEKEKDAAIQKAKEDSQNAIDEQIRRSKERRLQRIKEMKEENARIREAALKELDKYRGEIGHNSMVEGAFRDEQSMNDMVDEFFPENDTTMHDFIRGMSEITLKFSIDIAQLEFDSKVEDLESNNDYQNRGSYNQNIRLIDKLIQAISVAESKSVGDVWRDIKVAYFTGNQFYWKVLESVTVTGSEAVRKFATLPKIMPEDKFAEILGSIK